MATRNLTIMFTDIKGFTKRVSDATRKDLNRLLETHERLLRPVFAHFNGTIVKTIGDAFLVRFDSPTDAVMCGVAIQKILDEYNKNVSDVDQLNVRVAINSGDVELIEGDVMGEAVNIAARLEGFAEAGQVYFTEAVYLAMNRIEAPSAEVGEQLFKGIPYPVRVFRVLLDREFSLDLDAIRQAKPVETKPVVSASSSEANRSKAPAMAVAVVACLLGLLAIWLIQGQSPETVQVDPVAQFEAQWEQLSVEDLLDKAMPLLSNPEQAEQVKQRVAERVLQHLYRISEREGALAADEWLHQTIERFPFVEQASEEVMQVAQQLRLDARLASWQQQGDVPFDAVNQLVADFQGAEVPFRIAQQLQSQLPITMRAELYQLAMDRGMAPDDAIFNDLTAALVRVAPAQSNRGAHAVLLRQFPEQTLRWAEELLKGVAAPGILHGYELLKSEGDARADDPYLQALYQLADGYREDEQASAALAFFSQLEDAARRQQVLGVHRWLIEPKKGVSRWSYRGLQHVRANEKALLALGW